MLLKFILSVSLSLSVFSCVLPKSTATLECQQRVNSHYFTPEHGFILLVTGFTHI
ncbi:hypothetical protein I79_005328 [Cricetulus griseus]|uniref:Lipoprotein n=1 Tax=Cricetulus griseus TaxID=10029 RepID=G3H4W5_CRIGR|nr:hypothetical protein I79_005328 [Cricetulus griseus]